MRQHRHSIGTNVTAQLKRERMSEAEKFSEALRSHKKFTNEMGGRDQDGLPVIAFELQFPIAVN